MLFLGLVQVAHGAVPEDPSAPYAAAYLRGDYAEALKTLEQEGGDQPHQLSTNWAVDRAELLFILGRGDDALIGMREVVQTLQEPCYTVRLAEMLRDLGRHSDAEQAIQWAIQQNQPYYQRPQFPRENLLAMGRIARIKGENPNRVLQIYQQRLLARYPDFIAGYVEAGELALASYGYDVAEEYFLAALEQAPEHQEALVGLAETYWKANDTRFDEVRDRLEGLNPHHPRLQGMVLARALAAGDVEGGEAVLDDLLGINPNHRLGLANRAALAFLKDDGVGQAAALARLAELDPNRGDGYKVLGEIAARRYRFADAVNFLRAGLAMEPGNISIQSELGLNLLRIGEDDEGRTILEAAFETDRFNVQIYNMLEVMDTVGAFATLETPAFQIRLPDLEGDVMGAEVTGLLTEAMERYEASYAVSIQKPVHVQIFDDHDEFMVRSVGLPGNPGHLGICFGNLVTLDSPRARPPRSMNWRAVLWHEFVHVITLQKTRNRIPRWLSEGISVYEEGQRDPAWGQALQPEFEPLLDENNWPDVADLEALFVRPESPDHLMLGYFLAGEFVTQYVGAYGMPVLLTALDHMGAGDEGVAALAHAAGEDVSALDKGFGRHLSQACKPLKYLHHDKMPDLFIAKIPNPSFFEALEAGLASEKEGDSAKAVEHFEEAARLYPDFPGEQNPLRHLVALQRDSGDREAWAAALNRLRAHDSAAFDEPYAFLMDAVEKEKWEEVLDYTNWCVGIDPFDVALYENRRLAERALGHHEALLDTLAILAARDEEKAEVYQLEAARTLMALARPADARRIVLEVLEAFPEYREAQLVLLALHSAAAEGVPDAS